MTYYRRRYDVVWRHVPAWQQEACLGSILFKIFCWIFYSILASGDFCRLLITFANSLDPDRTSVMIWIQGWYSDSAPARIFWKKSKFWRTKVSRRQQNHKKLPSMQKVNTTNRNFTPIMIRWNQYFSFNQPLSYSRFRKHSQKKMRLISLLRQNIIGWSWTTMFVLHILIAYI